MNDKQEIVPAQNMLSKLKPYLTEALPKNMSADRMVKIAISELKKNPKLNKSTPESICGALMLCAQVGLEPNSLLGKIYLVPFVNKGIAECTIMLGYRGMIELAHRSRKISSIEAAVVYQNDEFLVSRGTSPNIHHVPKWSDRGDVLGVYAVCTFVNGNKQFDIMSKEDVEFVRSRSRSANDGPWVTDTLEMAKKTVIRRLFKYIPSSTIMETALAMDEAGERGEQNLKDVIDGMIINSETGEIESTVKDQASSLVEKLS